MEEGRIIEKVWGREVYLTNRPEYCAKQLYVTPGKICSLHRHLEKTETFIISQGIGWVELGNDKTSPLQLIRLQPGSFVHIEPKTWHRFWCETPMVILEVSTHHSDDDVERKTESGDIVGASVIQVPNPEPGPELPPPDTEGE